MPDITIELNDKGEPTGALPAELQTFFDAKFNEAFGKGAAKARAEAAKGGTDPVLTERLATEEAARKAAEDRVSQFELAEAERKTEYDKALKMREEKHSKELETTKVEIERRNTRLRESARSAVRAYAVQAGARDESLAELELILGAKLDLDTDTLTHFVKGADGKPAVDDKGEPVSIEGMVTEYIASHPHHRKPAPGEPGGASGGKSLAGDSGPLAEAEAKVTSAQERITKGDRSPSAINDLHEATAALKRVRQR